MWGGGIDLLQDQEDDDNPDQNNGQHNGLDNDDDRTQSDGSHSDDDVAKEQEPQISAEYLRYCAETKPVMIGAVGQYIVVDWLVLIIVSYAVTGEKIWIARMSLLNLILPKFHTCGNTEAPYRNLPSNIKIEKLLGKFLLFLLL